MFKYIAIVVVIGLLVIIGSLLLWYFNRPLPQPIQNQPLFEGIHYSRIVDVDAPLVYHLITIDLTQPDIRFFATPADNIEGYDYAARTTSGFLAEYGVQVAINGDFFDPRFSYSPVHYYPKVGDGVNARGLTMADGQVMAAGYAPDASATLYITADNQVFFTRPDAPVQTAISGNTFLVQNGRNAISATEAAYDKPHPRTAIALNQAGDTMMLFVVDGRQPNYSHGLTMTELAFRIIEHGGYTAINLDGGGSVAMVIEDDAGNPRLLNAAIHTRIPYYERPVANHFGVYAQRISDQH